VTRQAVGLRSDGPDRSRELPFPQGLARYIASWVAIALIAGAVVGILLSLT
jgi:hypothetical protein